jgi:hypothetical protein
MIERKDLPEKKSTDWLASVEIETLEASLPQLLEEALTAMKAELEQNGSSQEFINLRRLYGDKLKAWWRGKREEYFYLLQAFGPSEGGGVKVGEERILVIEGEDYYRDDEKILKISHRTPISESEITVTVSAELGLDIFLYPPKIISKLRETPDGDWKIYWEVIFRGPAISTITKTTLRDHPNYQLPYVKQIETIDASIFGIDNIAFVDENR